jgi:two-component system sensor histidine kinase ChiS
VAAQKDLRTPPLLADRVDAGRPAALQAFEDPEGRSLVGLSLRTRLGWTLVVEHDEAEVFAGLRSAQVWVGLVAWTAATALVKPIVSLTEMADRKSMGELHVQLVIESQDEIGRLAQAFGRMQFSLRAAMERLRRPAPT